MIGIAAQAIGDIIEKISKLDCQNGHGNFFFQKIMT
jgi:hypothetical protein